VPTSSWNKSSLALPCPVGVMLRCRRRASGGGVPFVNLFRSPGLVVRRCLWVAASAAFFCQGCRACCEICGRRAVGSSSSFPLRRWSSVVSEDPRSGELGRVPGRWAIADGFIPSFEVGVLFDSSQSHWAMGLLQISVVFIVLGGGGCRHWGCRAASASTGPRGLIVIFAFLGSYVQFGTCSSLYILFVLFCMCMYSCTVLI
jgi:hypothetical protein